jgi:hypothetical protein
MALQSNYCSVEGLYSPAVGQPSLAATAGRAAGAGFKGDAPPGPGLPGWLVPGWPVPGWPGRP